MFVSYPFPSSRIVYTSSLFITRFRGCNHSNHDVTTLKMYNFINLILDKLNIFTNGVHRNLWILSIFSYFLTKSPVIIVEKKKLFTLSFVWIVLLFIVYSRLQQRKVSYTYERCQFIETLLQRFNTLRSVEQQTKVKFKSKPRRISVILRKRSVFILGSYFLSLFFFQTQEGPARSNTIQILMSYLSLRQHISAT